MAFAQRAISSTTSKAFAGLLGAALSMSVPALPAYAGFPVATADSCNALLPPDPVKIADCLRYRAGQGDEDAQHYFFDTTGMAALGSNFERCSQILSWMNTGLGTREPGSTQYIGDCDVALKVLEHLYGVAPYWSLCEPPKSVDDVQACLFEGYKKSVETLALRQERVASLKELFHLYSYDKDSSNWEAKIFYPESGALYCDNMESEIGTGGTRDLISNMIMARDYFIDDTSEWGIFAKDTTPAKTIYHTVGSFDMCSLVLSLAHATGSYSREEHEAELNQLRASAEVGGIVEMDRFADKLRRRNYSFLSPYGEMLEVNESELHEFAFYTTKMAMSDHPMQSRRTDNEPIESRIKRSALRDAQILHQHIDTVEAAEKFLTDNKNGTWAEFSVVYEGAAPRFSAANYRQLARTAVAAERCNLSTFYKTASGQQSALMILLGGSIEMNGYRCTTKAMGQEASVWVDGVQNMRCEDQGGDVQACSAMLSFGCEILIRGSNADRTVADMMLCAPARMISLPSTAIVARDGKQFKLVSLELH